MDKNVIFGVIFAIIALGSTVSGTYFYFQTQDRIGLFFSALFLALSVGFSGGFLTKHQSQPFVQAFPKGGSAKVLATFVEHGSNGRAVTKYLIGNEKNYQIIELPYGDFVDYSNSLPVNAFLGYPAGVINLTRSGDGSGAITEITFAPHHSE